MIDKWLIVGGAHFGVTAVLLKLLGFILPNCIICYYYGLASFILYVIVARFTFELTKSWHLNEKIPPENRAVFITGCDSGFSLNLAKRLDSKGFHVFAGFIDVDGPGAKVLQEECSQHVQIVEIDVAKDSSVKEAVNFVRDNLGTSELWALVNNAEIQKGFEVELTTLDEFKDTMEVNGFGPVRVTKGFLPLLRQSRGRVINMTNPAGKVALPYITPYTMSKFAAIAFNECLKQELEIWGIHVISIEPVFCRNGVANPDLVKKNLENTFSHLEPDVRDDYGEKYLKSFKTFTEFICSSNPLLTNSVIDDMENAISMKYPSSEYKPSRNFLVKIANYILERGPPSITHFLIKICLFVSGFPRPQETENYL